MTEERILVNRYIDETKMKRGELSGMKRIVGWIIITMLLLAAAMTTALADDAFVVESAMDAADHAYDESYIKANLTTDRSYLRVNAYLEAEVSVNLSVTDAYGGLVYQRDYGVCSGSFRSEDIYLKLDSSPTIYQITMAAGDHTYTFPVYRVMPRLEDVAACSAGYPLGNITGNNSWRSATLIDVASLEGSSMTVPLCAGGAYTIGTVTFSVSGGSLTVYASIDGSIDGSIDSASVYVATTALEAQGLDTKNFTGIRGGGLNSSVDLNGASFAAVYVKMKVSFDPTDVPGSPEACLAGQDSIWQSMLNETPNEAVG